MAKNQKKSNSLPLMIGALVVLLIVGAILLRGGSYTAKPAPSVTTVESASDLNNASSDLDNTDIDSMDAELNQLDSDSSKF